MKNGQKRAFSDESHDDLAKLADGVSALFDQLPSQSHFRGPLVGALLQDVPLQMAARVTGMKPNTISKYRKLHKEAANELFSKQAAVGVARPRIGTAEKQAGIRQWLERFEVTKSGEKDTMYRTALSRHVAFTDYQAGGGRASSTLFNIAWAKLKVRKASHAKHDFFSCIKCKDATPATEAISANIARHREIMDKMGDQDATRPLIQLQIAEMEGQVAEIETHIIMFETQRDAYQVMRQTLAVTDLFLTLDFGTHAVQEGRERKLPDLVIVAHWVNEAGERHHAYLDCIPLVDKHVSKDWHYVKSSIEALNLAGFFKGYTRVIWWSDTGPNHFRVSNTIYFLREFQESTGIAIEVHFFAPHHGHSMCDGHIGAISRAVTTRSKKLADTHESWTREWVVKQMKSLKGTAVINAEIRPELEKVETLVGISNYLVFKFDSSAPGTVDVQKMEGAEPQRLTFTMKRPRDEREEENAQAAPAATQGDAPPQGNE